MGIPAVELCQKPVLELVIPPQPAIKMLSQSFTIKAVGDIFGLTTPPVLPEPNTVEYSRVLKSRENFCRNWPLPGLLYTPEVTGILPADWPKKNTLPPAFKSMKYAWSKDVVPVKVAFRIALPSAAIRAIQPSTTPFVAHLEAPGITGKSLLVVPPARTML